ncbi:MAG: thioredoxin family protein [Desulfamplus sp.]|nr:thioredoxin family protein [Desulfamplus sp.]
MVLKNISNITFIGSEDHYNHFFKPYDDSFALPEHIVSNLNLVKIPVEIKLYVANQCPHCPSVVRTLTTLAAACPNIYLKIIDGTFAADEAAEDKIMSVPCLILDGGVRLAGNIDLEQLIDIIIHTIINNNPSSLTTSSLKTILEDGKADWIITKMLEHNTIFEGFIGLITHKTWSVRLGAMVVLEEIAQKAPELALTIAPELLKLFNEENSSEEGDITTQGDILYALGEIGNPSVQDDIDKLIEHKKIINEDVLEAAHAAVESIKSRYIQISKR